MSHFRPLSFEPFRPLSFLFLLHVLVVLFSLLAAPSAQAQLTFKAAPTPPRLVFTPTVVTLQAQTAALQAQLTAEKIQLLSAQSGQAQAVAAEAALTAQISALNTQVASLQARLAAGNSSPPGTFGAAYTNAHTDGTHLVFAHYVVAERDYGGTVTGYERDIREAIAEGLDGFALNVGSWNDAGTGTSYQADTANIFLAAATVSPSGTFKLFLSPDCSGGLSGSGITAAQVVSMFSQYASSPNYLHVNSRPVLSSFGGEGQTTTQYQAFWETGVLTPLRTAGLNIYFIPNFSAQNYGAGGSVNNTIANNSANLTANLIALWGSDIDGLFDYTPGSLAQSINDNYAAALGSKALMASVGAGYWINRQYDRPGVASTRYCLETYGYAGLENDWLDLINTVHPAFVECVTWNDFVEGSWLSPIDDVAKYWPYAYADAPDNTPGFVSNHSGAALLNSYYIQWYKTGIQPVITKPKIFWSYRLSPAAAIASADPFPAPSAFGDATSSLTSPPNTVFVATLTPDVETLTCTDGTAGQSPVIKTFTTSAGVSNFSFTMNGAPNQNTFPMSFSLKNSAGVETLSAAGRVRVRVPTQYNFSPEMGFAQ